MSAQVTADRSKAPLRERVFRTDIQALRALAIMLVVLNHLWPTRLTGGYVGVDVFFVISGYLITGHLIGEVARSGSIRLGAFYARRIRRLLPAAFLVLLVSLVLVVILLPYPRWERNAWEIAASAGYVENWFLAAMSVNYSALNDAASAVQHYWSLSVEEQFYIFWPILLLAATAIAVRIERKRPRQSGTGRWMVAIAVVVLGVGLLSGIASIVFTLASPSQAYFATFTRGWEFAVGGAVAVLARRIRLTPSSANILSIVGFGAIAFSAFTYDQTTSFPGYAAALPVLGTAAVIAAGCNQVTLWHARVTTIRPIQWVGNVSYSLYLWHWPLIVVAPFVIGSEATTLSKLAVLVTSLALAAVTKRLVEDNGQRWRAWHRSTRAALVGMLAGMVVVAIAVSAVIIVAQARLGAQEDASAIERDVCAGPAATAPGADCDDPFGPADNVVMTPRNAYYIAPEECGEFLPILAYGDTRTTHRCDFSDGRQDALEVWLVGDSHAQQWQGAVFDIARDRGWVVTTSYMGGCPVADVEFVGFRAEWGPPDIERCRDWSHALNEEILGNSPDLVLTAMASRQQLLADGNGTSKDDQMVAGMLAYWEPWAVNGTRVLAIADPPFNAEVRSPECVLFNPSDPETCARPRAEAQPPDPVLEADARTDVSSIRALDVTDSFCDAQLCYAVVGKTPVYFDADHLNLDFAKGMRPQLEAAADELLSLRG
ncbi:acyltransferase family protein [Microbacterium sp. AK031]|uniref:acyltransferase family protein n=1 Tax=Microbacterium sp. AK031 TaxID=2723076 RepID=UPI0021690EB0|nr:acyltransferase family protein [Microbacterium sp. AK031]MCS3842106.1 peptidoglycan/LPS O-acetylase OafA/YrhL [Microbacterium sp. AK031]